MAKDDMGNSHYQIEAHGNLETADWADGPFCPHCGEREAIRTIHSQTTRPGIYQCLTCRKRFAGTLDILSLGQKRPPGGLPGATAWRKLNALRQYPLFRWLTFPLWYGGHIVRQLIRGSDPAPPGGN